MAFARTALSLASNLVEILDPAAAASAQNDVAGAAVTALYMLEIDNSENEVLTYFKAYNAAAPTIGTTAPDLVIPCAPPDADADPPFEGITRVVIPEGIAVFSTALSYACVTTPGTAGTSPPAEAVAIKIIAAV